MLMIFGAAIAWFINMMAAFAAAPGDSPWRSTAVPALRR
jgi:hypothetical protein